jgi:predicted nucleotidyltransferase
MKPSTALDEHREAIRSIILSHRARNPRVFGSAARHSDSAASDLDLLIDPTSETTLFDIGAIRHALIELLGVPVDVVTPNALPARFRQQVLAEAIAV